MFHGEFFQAESHKHGKQEGDANKFATRGQRSDIEACAPTQPPADEATAIWPKIEPTPPAPAAATVECP